MDRYLIEKRMPDGKWQVVWREPSLGEVLSKDTRWEIAKGVFEVLNSTAHNDGSQMRLTTPAYDS